MLFIAEIRKGHFNHCIMIVQKRFSEENMRIGKKTMKTKPRPKKKVPKGTMGGRRKKGDKSRAKRWR